MATSMPASMKSGYRFAATICTDSSGYCRLNSGNHGAICIIANETELVTRNVPRGFSAASPAAESASAISASMVLQRR
jgi:hypothetical protein